MASLGYIDTGYILPADAPWTLVEVLGNDSQLDHYAYVYDGNGSLEVYKNKTSQGSSSHTPSTETYKINNTSYDGSTTGTVRGYVSLNNVAWSSSEVADDYDNKYTPLYSNNSITVTHDSATSISSSITITHDLSAIAKTSVSASFDSSTGVLTAVTSTADSKASIVTSYSVAIDTKAAISSSNYSIAHDSILATHTDLSELFDTKVEVTSQNSVLETFDTLAAVTSNITQLADSIAAVSTSVSSDADSKATITAAVENIFDSEAQVSTDAIIEQDNKLTVLTSVVSSHDSQTDIITAYTTVTDTKTTVTYQSHTLFWVEKLYVNEESPILIAKDAYGHTVTPEPVLQISKESAVTIQNDTIFYI